MRVVKLSSTALIIRWFRVLSAATPYLFVLTCVANAGRWSAPQNSSVHRER